MEDGCLVPFGWPRGPLKLWLTAVGTVLLGVLIFYLFFSFI